MSTTTEEQVPAYAHCIHFQCPGYNQEEVLGVRTIRSDTVGDRGGDGALAMVVENTWEYLRFENVDKVACPHCGSDREIALQPRPVYQNLSGFPQAGLLEAPAYDPNVRNTKADEEQAAQLASANAAIAEMRQQMQEMQAQVAETMGRFNQSDSQVEAETPDESEED